MLKISVITPSFQQGEFIRQTIDSVLAQNYPNFEHIIMDGGSTDGTVEILKEYPHLIWSSGPDGGQTDALNKGFERATGDIIAWINSDDWYAPGTFERVAKELEQYTVVVGDCTITDREGNPSYVVTNTAREWIDIIKHWCPYSVPTQPAIFFRRSLLDEVRLPNGRILDETLDMCMDQDLWLRLFTHHKFHRIEQMFSYYRMYEDNKTGGASTQNLVRPEFHRNFLRYEGRGQSFVCDVSVIVPAQVLDDDLSLTINSIAAQTLKSFELIVVDNALDKQESKSLRSEIRTVSQDWHHIRYLRSRPGSEMAALKRAAEVAGGRYLLFLEPGAAPASTLLLNLVNTFQLDRIGLILPTGGANYLEKAMLSPEGDLILGGLFSLPEIPLGFAVRRLAFEDAGGINDESDRAFTIRSLFFNLLFKGWNLHLDPTSSITPRASSPLLTVLDEALNNLVNARIVVELAGKFAAEDFAKVRAAHQSTLVFEPQFIEQCKQIVAAAETRHIQ